MDQSPELSPKNVSQRISRNVQFRNSIAELHKLAPKPTPVFLEIFCQVGRPICEILAIQVEFAVE